MSWMFMFSNLAMIYMSALLLSRPLTKDELNEYVALNAKILTRI